MGSKIDELFNKAVIKALDAVVAHDSLRKYALKKTDERIYEKFVTVNEEKLPRKVQEDKYYMIRNMLLSINKAIDSNTISKRARTAILESFGKNILTNSKKNNASSEFENIHGFAPPTFLVISPGKSCNLACKACYASSSKREAAALDFHLLDRIITEKKRLWDSYFTVVSGGEPFLYKSEGKGIVDLAEKHKDNYFLVYTNGTLIDERLAERLAEVGNITPALSVEGFEKETDERRGRGVFKKIVKAFENLRNCGVPFGISITATRNNADLVVSDEFIDFFFNEQKALYGWIFQYMPIGRKYTLNLLVTPEQRLRMYKKTFELIYEKGIFIADFWNCGTVSNGCISAGREHGGYFYIDWNGNVTPCVFNPYSTHNIHEVYKNGGDLNTILFSPLFQEIRKWQREYSYRKHREKMGNQILPCPIRDHFKSMYSILKKCGVRPVDEQASAAFKDEEYHNRLTAYDEELEKLFNPIWERDYLHNTGAGRN